jgi:hypothetical protein
VSAIQPGLLQEQRKDIDGVLNGTNMLSVHPLVSLYGEHKLAENGCI